jgi:hypothetical protein
MNAYETFRALQKTAPAAAAEYLMRHAVEIERDAPKQ